MKTTIYIVLAVLCQKKPKAGRPKLKAYLPIVLLLCLFSGPLIAQEERAATLSPQLETIKSLRVGNTLPETFWNQTFDVYENGKFSQQNLAAYKDKLLILEFWATWCSSCTGKYKYLNSLQQNYGGQLKVILVNSVSTRDTKEKIAKNVGRLGKNYCSIVLDTTLYKQFLHTTVPHFIWINNGRWLAATGGDFVQKANIDAILDKKQASRANVQTN